MEWLDIKVVVDESVYSQLGGNEEESFEAKRDRKCAMPH